MSFKVLVYLIAVLYIDVGVKRTNFEKFSLCFVSNINCIIKIQQSIIFEVQVYDEVSKDPYKPSSDETQGKMIAALKDFIKSFIEENEVGV